MKIEKILSCDGTPTTPTINHVLNTDMNDDVQEREIELVVSRLSRAGYTRFRVYQRFGQIDKIVARYRVEQPEPEVECTFKWSLSE